MSDLETTTVTRNISLDRGTDEIVEAKVGEIVTRTGKGNYSAAVREIVREWASTQPSKADKKSKQPA